MAGCRAGHFPVTAACQATRWAVIQTGRKGVECPLNRPELIRKRYGRVAKDQSRCDFLYLHLPVRNRETRINVGAHSCLLLQNMSEVDIDKTQ